MSFFERPGFYLFTFIAIVVFIVFAILVWPNDNLPARISSVSGDVQVDSGSGYGVAEQDMMLNQGDSIKTGDGASAVIILYDSVLVRLTPNTEISIKDLSKRNPLIKQESGIVWTKFTKIGGVEEFNIQTPTTLATVKGTTLATFASPYKLIVGSGEVIANEGESVFNISSGEVLEKSNNGYSKRNMAVEERSELMVQYTFEIATFRDLRLRELKKNNVAMSIVRSKYNATDEQILEYFDRIDRGFETEDNLRSTIGNLPSANPIFDYDAEIKTIMSYLKLLPK